MDVATDLAVFLVYDRAEQVGARPGIERAQFTARCVSEVQLSRMLEALRAVGVYAEVLPGDRAFLAALASGRVPLEDRDFNLVYNGIEGGVAYDGYRPGRKALVPVVADAYGLICSNSTAHACAVGRHKFQYFTLLAHLGVPTPRVWHYRREAGWAGGASPPLGTRVVAKSTYESWAVGVLVETAIEVGDTFEAEVAALADMIGQGVCVQEFVAGAEVCVPAFEVDGWLCSPPVRVILKRSPHDDEAVMTFRDNLEPNAVAYESFHLTPSRLLELERVTAAACVALELSGFARIDYRIDASGQPWVIDVGVSPGVGMASSAFASLAELGFDYGSFVRVVIAASLASAGAIATS